MRGNAFTTPDGMCPVCGKTPENGYVRLYEGGREQCVARCHDALPADRRQPIRIPPECYQDLQTRRSTSHIGGVEWKMHLVMPRKRTAASQIAKWSEDAPPKCETCDGAKIVECESCQGTTCSEDREKHDPDDAWPCAGGCGTCEECSGGDIPCPVCCEEG